MSLRDTLLRNTFWYGLITVAGLVAGLVMSVVLARGLGPEEMGDYSFLLWVARTVHAVAVLGFALATVRYTASAFGQNDGGRASAYLGFFLRRQITTTTMLAIALLPVLLVWSPEGLRWPLLVLLVGLFPSTIEGIYVTSVYGAQRYDVTSRVSAVKMTLHLLTAAAAIVLGAGVLGVMIGTIFGTTISCLLIRRRALRFYPDPPTAIPTETRREMWSYLVPLSVVAVLETLVWDRSEVFFLRLYASRQDIAFYSLAFGLATKIMVLPEIAAGALLPAFSSLHGRGDRDEFARVYRTALRYVALIGAPLAVVGWALAPAIIEILYGSRYLPVGHLLGPLLLVAVVGVMRQVAWAALFAAGDRRSALNATWVSAVVNLGAAAVLIPAYGTIGAVAANAAGQLLASGWAFVAVARRHRCRFPVLDTAKVASAATMGLAVTLALRPAGLHLPQMTVAGGLGMAAFALVACLTGLVGTNEWTLVRTSTRLLARRVPWPSRALLVAIVGVGTAALYAPVLQELAGTWLRDTHYSYGFLVPVFSAWVAWDNRPRAGTAPGAGTRWGLLLVGAGLLVLLAGRGAGSLTVQALSLPVVLGGFAVWVVGPARARLLAFPLAFLAFMAPLPGDAVGIISLRLQTLAAWFTDHLLTVFAIPHLREGLVIRLRPVTLHVTEACSGLRFLLAMTVLGAAFSGAVRVRPRGRVAILAVALAVGLVANLVRVGATAVLADHFGIAAAVGLAHQAVGKITYLVMLGPFVGAVVWLRRRERIADVHS